MLSANLFGKVGWEFILLLMLIMHCSEIGYGVRMMMAMLFGSSYALINIVFIMMVGIFPWFSIDLLVSGNW